MAQYHKIKSIFKRDDNGKFIDDSFKDKKNTSFEYLDNLKNSIQDFFKEVEIRE